MHRGIKIGALRSDLFAFFPYLLNICRKFEFLISQGIVATGYWLEMLWCGMPQMSVCVCVHHTTSSVCNGYLARVSSYW